MATSSRAWLPAASGQVVQVRAGLAGPFCSRTKAGVLARSPGAISHGQLVTGQVRVWHKQSEQSLAIGPVGILTAALMPRARTKCLAIGSEAGRPGHPGKEGGAEQQGGAELPRAIAHAHNPFSAMAGAAGESAGGTDCKDHLVASSSHQRRSFDADQGEAADEALAQLEAALCPNMFFL